ncbi:nucleoside phosphorylase [Fusarium sp. NRRL 52700]|nr:nucleoside phosphorylase [Fusarium sp. NRRL 52700]
MLGPPKSRDGFHIGIVCARRSHYDTVGHIVDEFWDGNHFGRSGGDPNIYSVGRIGDRPVVIVLLSLDGKVNSATAVTSLRASYPRLELVLVTGICGGVPGPHAGEELLLGDVVISKALVQHDFGRQYPDKFEVKKKLDDCLGRPAKNIRNFVAQLQANRIRTEVEDRASFYLKDLQKCAKETLRGADYHYPGADSDRLYPPAYIHRHHSDCEQCAEGSAEICDKSRELPCCEIGCDDRELVQRHRLDARRSLERAGDIDEAQAPYIFVGHLGSGDIVFNSGEERDRLAQAHDLIAFETEGAGLWDEFPCIVVKGVCNYADSHKNKEWQDFAAATAAAVSKALIEEYPKTDGQDDEIRVGSDAPVFHADVSKCNIVTGFTSSGGTQVINFG